MGIVLSSPYGGRSGVSKPGIFEELKPFPISKVIAFANGIEFYKR